MWRRPAKAPGARGAGCAARRARVGSTQWSFSAPEQRRTPATQRPARPFAGSQAVGIRNTWMDWSFRAQRAGWVDFFRSDTAIRVSSESQAIPSTLR